MRNCRRRPHDAPTFTLPSRLALQAQANDEYVRFAMQDNDGTKPEHLSSWFKTKFDDLQLRYYVGPRCANYHQFDNWPGTVRYRWNHQCTSCAMLLPPLYPDDQDRLDANGDPTYDYDHARYVHDAREVARAREARANKEATKAERRRVVDRDRKRVERARARGDVDPQEEKARLARVEFKKRSRALPQGTHLDRMKVEAKTKPALAT